MNTLKNSAQLIGCLGNNPEMHTLDNGRRVARFSIATNERYTNSRGETVTDTCWHTIVAWGRMAELAEKMLQKGKEVLVSGKITNRSYVDKNNVKRWVTEIEVRELMLTSRAAA